MPPKMSAVVKELRDQFSQDNAAQIVEAWATKVIPTADASAAAAAGIQFASPAELAPPAAVLELLDHLQSLQASVVADLYVIRATVAVRVPEMKEEDNLGVAVQMSALKQIDDLEKELLGGDKATGATVEFKQGYLGKRASVEEKISPSGKDATPSLAPSFALQLKQIDHDAVIAARLALLKLSGSLRAFVNLYAENSKKLINPRNVNDRMIH